MIDLDRINDWFLAAAEVEARTPITAGPSLVRTEGHSAERAGTGRHTLARLIRLRRRQLRLTIEDLAAEANVDLEEVVTIEQEDGSEPEPRTIHQLSQALALPEQAMLELSGLVEASDPRFREATVRFVARSEPIQDLRPEEAAALEEFVKVLAGS